MVPEEAVYVWMGSQSSPITYENVRVSDSDQGEASGFGKSLFCRLHKNDKLTLSNPSIFFPVFERLCLCYPRKPFTCGWGVKTHRILFDNYVRKRTCRRSF